MPVEPKGSVEPQLKTTAMRHLNNCATISFVKCKMFFLADRTFRMQWTRLKSQTSSVFTRCDREAGTFRRHVQQVGTVFMRALTGCQTSSRIRSSDQLTGTITANRWLTTCSQERGLGTNSKAGSARQYVCAYGCLLVLLYVSCPLYLILFVCCLCMCLSFCLPPSLVCSVCMSSCMGVSVLVLRKVLSLFWSFVLRCLVCLCISLLECIVSLLWVYSYHCLPVGVSVWCSWWGAGRIPIHSFEAYIIRRHLSMPRGHPITHFFQPQFVHHLSMSVSMSSLFLSCLWWFLQHTGSLALLSVNLGILIFYDNVCVYGCVLRRFA